MAKKAPVKVVVPEGMERWFLDPHECQRLTELVGHDLRAWGAYAQKGFVLDLTGDTPSLYCFPKELLENTVLEVDLLANSARYVALETQLFEMFPSDVKAPPDACAEFDAIELLQRVREGWQKDTAELEAARRNLQFLRSEVGEWNQRFLVTEESLTNSEASFRRVTDELETLRRESSEEVAGLRKQLEDARRAPRPSAAPVAGEIPPDLIRTADAASLLCISNVQLLTRQKEKATGDPIGKLSKPLCGFWSKAEVEACHAEMFPNQGKRA